MLGGGREGAKDGCALVGSEPVAAGTSLPPREAHKGPPPPRREGRYLSEVSLSRRPRDRLRGGLPGLLVPKNDGCGGGLLRASWKPPPSAGGVPIASLPPTTISSRRSSWEWLVVVAGSSGEADGRPEGRSLC